MKPVDPNVLMTSGGVPNNFLDFTPLSDDGATTQMGDGMHLGPKSDVLSNDSPEQIRTNPMYLNMDQVHKANKNNEKPE